MSIINNAKSNVNIFRFITIGFFRNISPEVLIRTVRKLSLNAIMLSKTLGAVMKNKKVLQDAMCLIAVFGALFYALPLINGSLDSIDGIYGFVMLVNPVAVFAVSCIYGISRGFSILPCVMVSALFLPTVFFIAKNTWLYVPIYFGLSLTGAFTGFLIHRKKPENK